MDDAHHGVVVMSIGTNLNCRTFDKYKLKNIVEALSILKQRVIWKFEGVKGISMPNNVMIRNWLPQSDILGIITVIRDVFFIISIKQSELSLIIYTMCLTIFTAHKNVKVLWSHTGRLSTQEAVWHGVPVIGMPFYMDQRRNIQELVSKGAGVHLDFETLTTETILLAFDEILNKTRCAASNLRIFCLIV